MFSIKFFLFGVVLPLLFSCAGKSSQEDNTSLALLLLGDINLVQTTNESLDKVTTTQEGNGVFKTVVNATSTKEWVYFRFGDGKQTISTSINWDMRFKRFIIGTNSGTSGSGSSGVCNTNSTDFGAINSKDVCTSFSIDSIQNQTGSGTGFGDVNDSANPILFTWYNYNNTILSSKGLIYVLRSSSGDEFYKIQILDYYSQAGTSGYLTFRWAKLN